MRLGLQLGGAQLPAFVGPAEGILILVQLPQGSLDQDVAIRTVERFQHVGRDVECRGKALVYLIAQVENGPAGLC